MNVTCPRAYLVCLFLLDALLMVGQNDNLQHEIGEIIHYEANIDFSLVPGVLVGVIDGDSTYINGYGQPLSPDSLYELGSVTKPFVAWLVDQALDALHWTSDTSICTFLPDSICYERYRQLTFDEVLEHRTGLAMLPLDIGAVEEPAGDPYAAYDEKLLAHDLMSLTPSPGTYKYSHIGYALWYWWFEQLGGLEVFSNERFGGTLHLNHTKWDVADTLIAEGYGMDGRPNPVWHCQALKTAFGLKSSMNDLLAFIRLVSPSLVRNDTIHFRTLKKEINGLSRKGEYKLSKGWFLMTSGSSIVYYHSGRTGRHHVSIAFIPDLMKGVVVITNSSIGSYDLSLLVLGMVQRAKE